MTPIILRDDQALLKAGIYNGWQSGARNMLAVLPTGGGKSIVVSDILLDGHQQGLQECAIAHRTELVSQLSFHVANRGIPHQIIAPKNIIAQVTREHRVKYGQSFINPNARCAVAAVDTLIARADKLTRWAQQINRWTVDEAHHVLRANKWGKAAALFPNAYGLGVTATPQRADGMGLGSHHDGLFDMMVQGPTMRELINIGALTDYVIAWDTLETEFDITENDITAGGDFNQKKLAVAAKKSRIVGDVVREYVKHALFKRAICFATDVETAGNIAEKFRASGISAAAVSAETPSDVRAKYIEDFKTGKIMVLVNVDLFGEGFDVPACEVVIMARPTASLGLYLQMFGRALRTMFGKLYGLIIDHVGNVKRHGLPDKPHFWSMDRREKRSKATDDPEFMPSSSCLQCSRPYLRVLTVCPYCGAEKPLPEPSLRTIEQVDGDLTLLGPEALAAMRAAVELASPADVANRAVFAGGSVAGKAAANRQIEKHQAQERLREAIAEWAGWQRHLGRDDRQSYKRFYLAAGVDVLTAQTGTASEMNALADKVKGWIIV